MCERCAGSVASRMPPTGDLVCNPDTCPDGESNRQPFSLQAGTQPTEPHGPGLIIIMEFLCAV